MLIEVGSLTFLEFQQQNADGEEDENPNAGGYEADVDMRIFNWPSPLQDGPQGLGGFGERQEESGRLEPRMHAFDGPDDAA